MVWFIGFAIVTIGDIATTLYLTSKGAVELNPLMVLPLWAFLGVKLSILGLVYYQYKKTQHELLPAIAFGATSGAVAWNLGQATFLL